MPQVKCSVSNCEYWEKNNNCGADTIMIDIDAHSKMKFDAEFAGESFDSEHQDAAKSSANTCCHTYKARKHA